MKPAEQRLLEDRATRDAARAVFNTRLGRVRDALAERSVGKRISNEALDRSKGVMVEAMEIASDSKWVVAGSTAALLAWLARGPIVRLARDTMRKNTGGEPDSRWRRFIANTAKRIRT